MMNFSQPVIDQIRQSAPEIHAYERVEWEIDLTGDFRNPFDYEQILVIGEFTSPSGQSVQVEGFFMELFSMDGQGRLSPHGTGFAIRFCAAETGLWQGTIIAKDRNGVTQPEAVSFRVLPEPVATNPGFIRTGETNYLQHDNGSPCIPLGYNMCWQHTNPVTDYGRWLDSLSLHGGNYIRLWHAHWGLGLEWRQGWDQFQGLGRYHQQNAWYQDWLFDYCRSKGGYVMLCLQHHGQLSTQVNPEWSTNPYNIRNGGPCSQPRDFFTNEQAIALTKNRLRYVIARWGHHTSIMAWELMNEVEWMDGYDSMQQEVMLWHAEMAAFLKAKDPYHHLVTTSFAKADNDPLVWGNTDIDLTQIHHYDDEPDLEVVLADLAGKYLGEFHKPVLVGEFGTGQATGLAETDPGGIHVHNGMWASLMGGSVGTGMPWWWDNYLYPQQLFGHLPAIASVIRQTPFLEDHMSPAQGTMSGIGNAYILKGASGQSAAGWIHHPQYRHESIARKGLPSPVRNATLSLNGLQDTALFIRWFHCLSGAIVHVDSVLPEQGNVTFSIPPFIWDLAFVLGPDPVSSSDISAVPIPDMHVYPNPVKAGERVTIVLPASVFPNVTLELINIHGQRIITADAGGRKTIQQEMPGSLPPGLYWWRINSFKSAGIVPVIVLE